MSMRLKYEPTLEPLCTIYEVVVRTSAMEDSAEGVVVVSLTIIAVVGVVVAIAIAVVVVVVAWGGKQID